MEKIKINNGDVNYGIVSITPVSEHVLQVVFADTVPQEYGDITVYTSGGDRCASLPGYDTVYRDEGQTVYLSNDGSVYVPPDPETPPAEPYEPTVEERLAAAKASKKREVSAACQQTIYRGVTVELADGSTEHFALTDHDQLNLFGKQVQLAAGVELMEYHADGQPCRYYSAADMAAIVQAAMWHVSYHTTYCNALNIWIASSETVEETDAIFYGADVPEEYQSDVLKAYLLQIANMATGGTDETAE